MLGLVGPTRVTLVLPDGISLGIMKAVLNPLETAGVLLASIVACENGELRILGREMHWLGEEDYSIREQDRLSIPAASYVRSLSRGEQIGAAAIWVHTHPAAVGIPLPSRWDEVVDSEIAEVFRIRTGHNYYGALIFSPASAGLSFSGHLEDSQGKQENVNRAWLVGDRFRSVLAYESSTDSLSPIFDRNIKAFGGEVQRTLQQIHVGVVGCGGTGSAAVEQLARLGVRRFTLIDPDVLSGSNVTRVYGTADTDVGQSKVSLASRNIRRISRNAMCREIVGATTAQRAARSLDSCDIVFGCTDDNAGRLVLSRLATYLLLPVIDCGVLLSSDRNGVITGIDGRVTIVLPEQACLVCRGRIDLQRAAAEMLTEQELKSRVKEGYAPNLAGVEPAVVTFTTFVAAAAVSELLERLIGYGPEPRPNEVLLRCHEREISSNIGTSALRHYCHPSAGKVGAGITTPFLEISWAN